MAASLKLPVGIEDFQEIRRLGFYYVDKTKLIEQLLESWGKVNLFTRPRRFGKTLNMSMLRCFLKLGQTEHCLMAFIFLRTNSSAISWLSQIKKSEKCISFRYRNGSAIQF